MQFSRKGLLLLVIIAAVGCQDPANKKKDTGKETVLGNGENTVQAQSLVTPENFIRAETDRMFYATSMLPGAGINRFYHAASITPLDSQTVVRMNRDVLYSGAVVDAGKGASILFPVIPDGRYASVLVIDNDHYCSEVLYRPGKHRIPNDTKYVLLALRIQVFDPKDRKETALVRNLQQQFVIEAASADPFPKPNWDTTSLNELHKKYEKEFSVFKIYPDDWMGPRGQVNEATRHLAAAGAWGLFPNNVSS